ncbi:hypothetical protein D3C81_1287730 [compost metagenome]
MCLYALGMLIGDMLNNREKLVQTLFRLRRQKDHWGIRHKQEMIPYILFELMHRLIIFFHNIPFINYKNGCFTRFVSITCNVLILLNNTFLSIDKDKDNVRSLNSFHSTHDTVFFNIFVHFTAFSHTRSINKYIFLPIFFKRGVNGVSCRSGYIAYNDSFFTQYRINKRRFTDIGTTD